MLCEPRSTTVAPGPELSILLRDHQPRLRAICRSMCRFEDDPEELFQDACVDIIRHIGGYRGDASFVTWATTVIRSQLGRQRRRRRRYAVRDQAIETVVHSFPEFVGRGARDPEDHAGDERLRVALGVAMAQLSELDREVFMLRQAYGMTAPEVAERLGLSVAAVKSRLHRARRELRSALDVIPFAAYGAPNN